MYRRVCNNNYDLVDRVTSVAVTRFCHIFEV